MDENKETYPTEPTTFNMWIPLKEKAKIYIAANNRKVNEAKNGEKVNLGVLINKALQYYLKDIKIR